MKEDNFEVYLNLTISAALNLQWPGHPKIERA
jgi:hypothetical protein